MMLPLLMALSAAAPTPLGAPADGTDTLTVVTLNIWHDQRDWPRRLSKILAGLRALRPDVVCLQEVLQHGTLPNQAGTLADSLGFQAHFASVDSVTREKRYGNAILTPHPVRLAGEKPLEPLDDYRIVAHLRVDVRGRPIDVYDTHLHHTPEGGRIRATQIRDLLGFIAATRGAGPVVLAGDFNAGPEAEEMRLLEPGFVDVFAAANPGASGPETATMNPRLGNAARRIDRIFIAREGRPSPAALSARVIFRDPGPDSVWASDHFGVVARVVVPAVAGGPRLPVLQSTRPVVSVREGEVLRPDAWRLAPEVSPDVYEVDLPDGGPRTVAFLSDVDSLRFTVAVGRPHDFLIRHGSDLCATRIVGVRPVPAAEFDAAYRAAHQGKISVEVPEVYELVNVALAMTATGQADRNMIYHDSDYYAETRKWFDPHRGHPAIAALDSALAQNPDRYSNLKMNGYSFEFDGKGRIVQSRVYDRTGFASSRNNTLRPFIRLLQSFADASKFREFYRRHRSTYAGHIAFYTDTADVEAMRSWLGRNFPGVKPYDSHKIVFSPLVAYNQSATWLESHGFRELQAHVNYPYPQDVKRRTMGATLSKKAETILRGDIVFTELNHGYINPEADRYADRVLKATSRRDLWVDSTRGPNYYGGISAFNEHMNWGLVSLRAVDFAPEHEPSTLIDAVDEMMTKRRGFPQFAAFDSFLVDLYRHRETGRTIADLYPRIIEWFEARNAR